MKTKLLTAGLCLLAYMTVIFIPGDCLAAVYFLNDKLRLKGTLYQFAILRTNIHSEEKQYRDTRFGLMRTKATAELLYSAYEDENMILNFFGYFQYWHEAVPDFDTEYRKSIPRRNVKRYQGPFFSRDDWINELYTDFYVGKWNIRLGKQIVFWSETEMVRTIDRINPLDLRYTTPGIDPWDQMKIGLWMMRGNYRTELPGQLQFEWIWIPGDFEQVRTPMEGTSMGSSPAPQGPKNLRPRRFGQAAAIESMWRSSYPAFKLSNSTIGLRLRANSALDFLGDMYIIDWTLTYYRGMNTTAVPKRRGIGDPSILNMDPTTVNGYMNNLAVSRVFGQPLPVTPRGLWRFDFFDAVGGSFQTYIPKLKGVVRGEIAYEIGLPEIKCFPDRIDPSDGYQKLITGVTNRDVLNWGFTYDVPILITPLVGKLGGSGVFDTTFGYFGQRRMGNISRIRRTFGYNARTETNFTLLIRYRLMNNTIWPVIRSQINTRRWGYNSFSLRYTPGQYWKYEIGYLHFFASDPWDSPEANAHQKDLLYLRIGFEF